MVMTRHNAVSFLAGMAMAFTAHAAVQELDSIVAIVDDDVVLKSELDERINILKNQYSGADVKLPPDEVLRKQVLNRLIVDSIQLQMGNKGGIRISDEGLTTALVEIAKQNNMSLQEFRAELIKDGVSYRAFREQIRRDLIIREVQRHQISGRIYVSPEEVAGFLASPASLSLTAEDYLLGHILIAVSARAPKAKIEAAEAKADEIYQSLLEGASFNQLAIEHSDGRAALEGGSLGWKKAAELPELFADQATRMAVGDVQPPIRNASGFHLISLLDKKGGTEQEMREAKVRHILISPSEIRSAREAENLIKDLHERVLAGEDFTALAREHSDDPGSALLGGDLGWVRNETLVAEFAAQIDASEVNAISAPFKTRYGWHVLEVLDRRNLDVSQEQLERKAMQFLSNRRFDEEFENFLTEIRNNAYVEIK